MRKTLIIGAGGTGIEVIKRVRSLIEWRHNEAVSQVPFVRFLGLDTATDKGEQPGPDHFHLNVSQERVSTILMQHGQQNMYQWIDTAVVGGAGAITDGAGGIRMLGKLAFWEHYSNFRVNVGHKLQNLSQLTSQDIPAQVAAGRNLSGRLKIYVIANTVSGTGSGSFIDIGFALRHYILNDARLRANVGTIEITALLTLPDNLQDRLQAANSYSALEELNHFISDLHNYQIDDPLNPPQMLSVPNQHRPFDFVYLLNSEGGIHNHKELENIIGEYIYNDIFSPQAEIRDGQRDNVRQHFQLPDGLGYYSRCMTFGMASIAYPIAQITRACTFRFLVEGINFWFNLTGPDTTNGQNEWASVGWQAVAPAVDPTDYQTILENSQLGLGNYERLGSLHKALIQPVTLAGVSEKIHLVNAVNQFIDSSIQKYRGQIEALNRLETRLEAIFNGNWQHFEGEILVPGIVGEVIRINREHVVKEAPGLIKQQMLNLLFSGHQGAPHFARKFLDEHIMKQFNASNSDALGQDGAEATLKKKMVAARNELADLEGDFMLVSPLDFFRAMARRRALEAYRSAVRTYFRAKLTAKLYSEQGAIATSLQPTIECLDRRLGNFTNYMLDGWRQRLIEDYDKELKQVPVNGFDLLNGNPQAEIETQYARIVTDTNRERKMVDFVTGLGNHDSEVRKDLGTSIGTTSRFDGAMESLTIIDDKTGERSFRRFRPHEETLVQPVRTDFHGSIGQQDVLDRFLNVGTEQDINAVNQQATLLIQAPWVTPDSIPFDQYRMLKQWFFYPGGQLITAPPPIPPQNKVQEFAGNLQAALGEIDWPKESHDSYDKHTILFLRERGAFAIRLIQNLHLMKQAAQPGNFQGNSQDWQGRNVVNPLVSRVDINITPLDISDRQKLVRSRRVFVIAIAAGLLERSGQRFRWAGQGQTTRTARFIQGQQGDFPIRPIEAAYTLYRNDEWFTLLEQQIADLRQTAGNTTLVTRIHTALNNLPTYGLTLSFNEENAVLEDVLMGYVKADPVLHQEWNQAFPGEPLTGRQMSASFHQANVDAGGPYPRDGFYCNRCEGWVTGSEHFLTQDNRPDPTQLPSNCENPFCGGQTV